MKDYRGDFKRAWRLVRWYRGDTLECSAPDLDTATMRLLAGICYLAREPRLVGRREYLGMRSRPNLTV